MAESVDEQAAKPVRQKLPQTLWHESHLKPPEERFAGSSFSGGCAEKATGYGPDNTYSLLLPSPRVTRSIKFIDGKATVQQSGDLLSIPEIVELRDRVLKIGSASVSPTLSEIAFPDTTLAEYSAALLRLNYNLTDDDLTFLHSGKVWMETLITHALGGKEARDNYRNLDTSQIARAAVDAEQLITSAMIANEDRPQLPSGFVEGDAEDYAAIEDALAASDLAGDDFDITQD